MSRLSASDQKSWQNATRDVTPIRGDQIAPCFPKRKISVPDPEDDQVIDLHGRTLHQAFLDTKMFVERARAAGIRDIVVITGLSGQIRKEFPRWCETIPHIFSAKIEHTGGSFRLRIK